MNISPVFTLLDLFLLLNAPLCSPASLQLTVCLRFGAEQVVNRAAGLFRASSLKTAVCCSENDTMRALREGARIVKLQPDS